MYHLFTVRYFPQSIITHLNSFCTRAAEYLPEGSLDLVGLTDEFESRVLSFLSTQPFFRQLDADFW